MGNQHPTPNLLSECVKQGDLNGVVKLVQAGFPINTADSAEHSPIRIALFRGETDIFKFLFNQGATISPDLPQNQTPLHIAVRLNHYSLARYLLREKNKFGAMKNAQDDEGLTPLHVAALTGNSTMVALLLKYNAITHLRDKLGRIPQDIAIGSKSHLADEIIEQFMMEDIMDKRCHTPFSGIKLSGVDTDESPFLRDQVSTQGSKGSKSTIHGTKESEFECPKQRTELQEALKETRIPLIKGEELQFGDMINVGSSCVVYKGLWRGTEVAIKQFKLEYSTSPKEMHKFVKELQVLAQVRHPNLLLLMGLCIDLPQFCLITEYIPNNSLFYALHKRKDRILNLQERLRIALQIVRAISYLHNNEPPIIHRDLKPENILLDHNLNVKIADFGLARPLSRFTDEEAQSMTTICIGTTRFMAPELFDKETVNKIGIEIDIWSVGCVLIELFSNKRPWHYISSSKANCIYYEIFKRKPVPIPDRIPAGLQDILRSCCQYEPSDRPSAVTILETLEEFQASLS